MKVLVYDSDFASSGNIYPIKSALEELGHEAVMFDWRKYQYTYSDSSISNRFLDRFFINNVVRKINEDLIKEISSTKFDTFLVLRGEHITAETIEFALRNVTHVVNWNTDDLFNPLNSSNNVIKAFSKYHIHFTPRMHLRDEYIKRGARNVKRVDWYYRPELAINNFPEIIGLDCDIRFIGSMSKRRLSFLSALKNFNCEIYGWGWKKKMYLLNFPHWNIFHPIGYKEMTRHFLNTRININLMTIENRDLLNLRAFEIPAAGGFQICERTVDVLQIFKEDKEIVCFDSPEELASKCEFYLRNESIRESIARAGYERVISGKHKLIDSVEQLILQI
jgi:spore maturation protein CgeB